MKKLQRFCASLSLAVALSASALANSGNIQTGATQPPPPPPQTMVVETSGGNTSSTTGTLSEVNGATSVDPLAELALALLQGVLFIC